MTDPTIRISLRPRAIECALGRLSGVEPPLIYLESEPHDIIFFNPLAIGYVFEPNGAEMSARVWPSIGVPANATFDHQIADITEDQCTAAVFGLGGMPYGATRLTAIDGGASGTVGYCHAVSNVPGVGTGWDDSVDGVAYRSGSGAEWGVSFKFAGIWNPCLLKQGQARVDGNTVWHYQNTSTNVYYDTWGVPWNGPSDGVGFHFGPSATEWGFPLLSLCKYPVWVFQSNGSGWSAGDEDRLREWTFSSKFSSPYFTNPLPVLLHGSVWWHDPAHAYNFKPHVIQDDWNRTPEGSEVTNYWMGCGNYSKFIHLPLGGYRVFPPSVSSSEWPPAATSYNDGAYFNRWIPFDTLSASASALRTSTNKLCPMIKIDGGYKGPAFSFRMPQKLRDLVEEHGVENVSVTASTAEVRMAGVSRSEFRLVAKCGRAIAPTNDVEFGGFFSSHYPGHTYGPTLYQLSDDEEGGEEWRVIYKYTGSYSDEANPGDTPDSVGSSVFNPDNDNTHRTIVEWAEYIESEIGEEVTILNNPTYVPKLPPWDYVTSASPKDISPLSGAKLAHCLIGKQYMGKLVNGSVADKTTRPHVWMGNNYQAAAPEGVVPTTGEEYLDFEDLSASTISSLVSDVDGPTGAYQAERLQATCREDVLKEFLDLGNDYTTGLEPVAYRVLARNYIVPGTVEEPWAIENQVIAESTWTEVDMLDIARALRSDEPEADKTLPCGKTYTKEHFEYEIRPCLPHFHPYTNSFADGVCQNLEGWANTFLPGTIEIGAAGESLRDEVWTYTLDNICFQSFDAWEMRNWQIQVSHPGGSETIRIPTPWDAA